MFSGSGMNIGGDNEIIHVPDNTDETKISAASDDHPGIRLLFSDANEMLLGGCVLYVDRRENISILKQCTKRQQLLQLKNLKKQ